MLGWGLAVACSQGTSRGCEAVAAGAGHTHASPSLFLITKPVPVLADPN